MKKITSYQRCKMVRSFYLKTLGEVMAYNWPDAFAIKTIRGIPDKIKKWDDGEYYLNIDPSEFSQRELLNLGFQRWVKGSDMMLIPIWILPLLSSDLYLISITGEKGRGNIHKKDNDSRFGFLAYGVYPRHPNREH